MTEKEFIESLKELNVEINISQREQLNKYYELLVEWNEKINLTSITEKKEVYLKHFYDSITLIKAVNLKENLTLADLGTGAGFPGLVLKIIFPNLKITLIDALNKRIEFLKLVINELNLTDIEVIHTRSEEYAIKNREKFDIVTARAVAQLPILLEYAIPLVKVNGYFIPMKANISREIIDSQKALQLLDSKIVNIVEFNLPFEESVRTLVKVQKLKETNKKYPRKYSEIKKKHL